MAALDLTAIFNVTLSPLAHTEAHTLVCVLRRGHPAIHSNANMIQILGMKNANAWPTVSHLRINLFP